MKKPVAFFGFIALYFNILYSQSLRFSYREPACGRTDSCTTSFRLTQPGDAVYFYYDHTRSFLCDEIYFDIYRNDRYQKRVLQKVQSGWTYCWQKVLFYNPGEYEVEVLSTEGVKWTSQFVDVLFDSLPDIDNTPISTTYFSRSDIIFCDSVTPDGSSLHPSKVFIIGRNGRWLHILLTNRGRPFRTGQITMEVSRVSEKGKRLSDIKSFTINPDYSYTYLKYFFRKPGTYKISFSAPPSIWINTRDLVLKRRK